MVLCEPVSDFLPNLVRIFKRNLDSQQSRILTACCLNIADISYLSKVKCMLGLSWSAWTSEQTDNEQKTPENQGAVPFQFTSGVSWGLSFPSDHSSCCELRAHHSFKTSAFQYISTEITWKQWKLWPKMSSGALERLCESSLQRVAHSLIKAETWQGAGGWLLTAPRALLPIQASLGALLCTPLGFGRCWTDS